MFLSAFPFLPDVSKTTSRFPFPPGGIGFVSYSGTVHPQLVVADADNKICSPLVFKFKHIAHFFSFSDFSEIMFILPENYFNSPGIS